MPLLIPTCFSVASLAEAWIEIYNVVKALTDGFVASLAEAWIEMLIKDNIVPCLLSPPSRRRGLKSF